MSAIQPGGLNTVTSSDSATWIQPDKGWRGFLRPRRLLLASDLVAACAAFACMYLSMWARGGSSTQVRITLLNGSIILLATLALLLRSRQYSAPLRLSSFAAIGVLTRDLVIGAAVTALLSYVSKGFFTGSTSPSRLALIVLGAVFFLLGAVARLALGALQRRQYAEGRGVRRVLIGGSGRAATELMQHIADHPQLGVVAVGKLRLDIAEWPHRETAAARATRKGHKAASSEALDLSAELWPTVVVADDLDGLVQLDSLLRTTQATEVLVALDPEAQGALPRLTTFLSLAHVPFRVAPALFEDTYRASELLGHAEIPVVDLRIHPLDRLGRLAKRTLDLCLAFSVTLILLPLELLIVLVISATSGWPVIFAQQRVGKNGRRFTLYKFRTMVKDAEAKLLEVETENELAASEGRMFKMRRDPRVTRVGAVLRRLSLDELPQFINVLKGDMSVVGPRPPLPREVANYEREHLYRLRALPGITGLWQVSGRNDLSFEEMVGLDRYYVDNWSIALDMRIIFKTMSVLVTRKGAY